MVKAEQLVKVKNACSSGDAKVKESGEALEKAKEAAPEGDLSLVKADAIDEACPTAMTLIRAVGNMCSRLGQDSTKSESLVADTPGEKDCYADSVY